MHGNQSLNWECMCQLYTGSARANCAVYTLKRWKVKRDEVVGHTRVQKKLPGEPFPSTIARMLGMLSSPSLTTSIQSLMLKGSYIVHATD